MITKYRLPFSFDIREIKKDLDRIDTADWIPHFNAGYYSGEWSGVVLRAPGGDPTQLYPAPNSNTPARNTEILARCPALGKVLKTFKCEVRSARLLKLGPGGNIREHRDYDLGFPGGEIRLHVPIVTNPEVEFVLNAERVELNEGECWYLDFSLPHWVVNRGPASRIHLVLDCGFNDWLKGFFPPALDVELPAPADNLSSPEQFEQFRKLVLRQTELQKKLGMTDDRITFVRVAVTLGNECGYRFSASDVENALRSARRATLETWIA